MSFLHPFHHSPLIITIQPLAPLRRWINAIEVHNQVLARCICRLVPNTCTTGYTLGWGDRTWLHLPSLCKLNPLFDECLDLRFRAADYLYEHSCL